MTKITLNNVASLIDATTAANTINSNNTTIQTAFDNTLSRNGSTPNMMLNTLDMNGNQVLNLPVPSTINSPARLIDVVSNPTIVIPGTGTSGHVVPFLDGNNIWSGGTQITGNPTSSIFTGSNGTASIWLNQSSAASSATLPEIGGQFTLSSN